MSKYIDKDELWERLKKHMVHHIVTNTLFNTIKAVIDGMPTIEVSEDCISREVAIDIIKNYDFEFPEYMERFVTELRDAMKKDLVEDIRTAPSVIPKRSCYRCGLREDCEDSTERKPKEGEWIINEPEESGFGAIYECPYCKYEVEFEPTNYCPNCGAKMKG